MQRRQFIASSGRTHPKIDQAAFQVGAFNPVGDGLVMGIWHNQRQAKTVEQTFGSAFPVAFFGAHLDQFAGKRHVVFG